MLNKKMKGGVDFEKKRWYRKIKSSKKGKGIWQKNYL